MRGMPGTHLKIRKPASKTMLIEYQETRPRKSKRPKLIRRAAGIGNRAKWNPEIEQYVIQMAV